MSAKVAQKSDFLRIRPLCFYPTAENNQTKNIWISTFVRAHRNLYTLFNILFHFVFT